MATSTKDEEFKKSTDESLLQEYAGISGKREYCFSKNESEEEYLKERESALKAEILRRMKSPEIKKAA